LGSEVLFKNTRITREIKTIETMVRMYCRRHHETQTGICRECDELLTYAKHRLEKCPFQGGKTTCAKCPVHCYKTDKREKIREVMKFSGPKMIFIHPIMALLHIKDGLRKKPIELNNTK
jgi:hypothetical protein